LAVTVSNASETTDLRGYDAAVVGSALYLARWRPEAVRLLTKQAKFTGIMPMWLFQSGPLDGEEAARVNTAVPKNVRRLSVLLHAAPPVTIGGRLEVASAQGFLARRMAHGDTAGDYRDFDAIGRWASGIAEQLAAHAEGSEVSDVPDKLPR
jgi:menaquinone-dependent protoporphyrinogen oxidase